MNDAILDETLARTVDNPGTTITVEFTEVPAGTPGNPSTEVTAESVQDAALRFRSKRVAVLNFASGTMPGGGTRYGYLAQEEALCFSSGTLHGLEDNLEVYNRNRAWDAPPESFDLMIWSRDVPLIRDGKFRLVEPMNIQVCTYPAPNKSKKARDPVPEIFARRCKHVVHMAATNDVEVLILGAWGCGVYGNDPTLVAEAFRDALATHSGSISQVVFAVYGDKTNQAAFARVFKARG